LGELIIPNFLEQTKQLELSLGFIITTTPFVIVLVLLNSEVFENVALLSIFELSTAGFF
jgi:hypothetical protein